MRVWSQDSTQQPRRWEVHPRFRVMPEYILAQSAFLDTYQLKRKAFGWKYQLNEGLRLIFSSKVP
jgi:hypothetical protein